MCTVGYGDILPTRNEEMFLSIFTMIVATSIFAHAINTIGGTFESMNEEYKRN